jgi:hypothetical protein
MKTFTTIILASLILSVLIIVSLTRGYAEPLVGVKEDDWI